jgi:hypothetical protein
MREELKARLDVYLVKRVKELKALGWTEDQIMQQLQAVATSKRELRELIQQISQ